MRGGPQKWGDQDFNQGSDHYYTKSSFLFGIWGAEGYAIEYLYASVC